MVVKEFFVFKEKKDLSSDLEEEGIVFEFYEDEYVDGKMYVDC